MALPHWVVYVHWGAKRRPVSRAVCRLAGGAEGAELLRLGDVAERSVRRNLPPTSGRADSYVRPIATLALLGSPASQREGSREKAARLSSNEYA